MKILALRRALLGLGLCAAAVGTLATAAPAHATPAQFVGTWLNVDPGTRGIVRLKITAGVHGLGVEAFGACVPTACDWGLAGLTTYGNNVSDPDHKFGTAAYSFDFKQTAMTFQLLDPNTLVVDDYNMFTDGSGRENYHSREVFKKLVIRPLPFPPLPIAPIGP
jgi:hypothetical protein